MHNFDIAKLDDYTITQLADFVIAGKTTVKDLFDGGLSPYCRPKLLKELEFRYKKAWQEAEEKGSVESFNDSIVVYDCQPPRNLVTHAQENDQAIPMKTVPMDQLHDAKSGESIEILNDALKTTCNTSTKSVSETVNRKSSASNVSNSASVTQTSSGQENADSQDSVNPGMLSPGKSIGKQDRLKKDTAIYRFVKKWGKACLAGIVAIVIIPVVVHFATKKGSEDYLSQDRIEAIIKNYQDSLKNEIFDGFLSGVARG